MTNEEWLKSLSTEKLGEFLGDWCTICADKALNKSCRELGCDVCAEYWLRQEHKDEK